MGLAFSIALGIILVPIIVLFGGMVLIFVGIMIKSIIESLFGDSDDIRHGKRNLWWRINKK